LFASVPLDVTLTVTASPTKGLEATISLAQRLCRHGYPGRAPHLGSPGGATTRTSTTSWRSCASAGSTTYSCPPVTPIPPVGRFDSALSLLERLDEVGRPFSPNGDHGLPQTIRASTTT